MDEWVGCVTEMISCLCNRDGSKMQQPYRSAFHFQPSEKWMNDPNGPVFYNGMYHIFYQYNPHAPTFEEGSFSWGHSVSRNLVDWVHLNHALTPTDPFDFNGCWSGSITILPDGTPAILYTGINSDGEKKEVQNLALAKNSSDPYLREWIKSDRNPIIIPEDDIGNRLFRDPTTAWKGRDGIWRMLIGGEIHGHGTALLYKSDDFVEWTRSERPLHFSERTNMWECPDFYPVSVGSTDGFDTCFSNEEAVIKSVLKASFHGRDYYVIGAYDPETDEFIPDVDFMSADLRFDYGTYYASKSFYDSAKRRRISWAWIPEADTKLGAGKKGWSSLQSFPRSIWLDEGGNRLVQWPVTEIESLRRNEVSIHNKKIRGGAVVEIKGITASQADVEVSFKLPNVDDAELLDPESHSLEILREKTLAAGAGGTFGPFGLFVLASDKLTELTAVYFRIYRNIDGNFVVFMCSDQRRSSLREDEVEKSSFGVFLEVDPTQETISLRTLIDHSIVESFGEGGKACITARVYPQLAVANEAHLRVFNYGTETVEISNFSGWSMDSAQFSTSI